MSHQPVIDGFEFASAGAAQQGVWPLSGFARLRDLLASDAGEVGYALQGTRDARGRRSLRVSVSGTHRAHDHLSGPTLAGEPTTGETHLRHHVSPTGFYRGKKVIKTKSE